MVYEAIRQSVLDGKPRLVKKEISEALERGIDPREILEKGLLAALDEIENSGCEDEEQITAVLASARAMKKGIESIEEVLGEELYTQDETVLIGTATGDLHDMGKDIVALYFRSAGFPVVDLGVDVSAGQFLKALEEYPKVRIVCISALLKTSCPEVRHIIQAVRGAAKDRDLFLMIGGGSMSEELAVSMGADCYTDSAVSAVKAARAHLNRSGS